MKMCVSHVSKMLILTYNRPNSVITKTAIILNIKHNIFNLRNTECHIIVYGDIVNNLNKTTSSSIACELWNLNSILVSGLTIIIKVVWTMYNGNIEVTVSGRKLNIDVKWDVNIKKWGRGSCVSCMLYLKSFEVY